MRVLLCPTAFEPWLSAGQAADAMAAGWLASAPHDEVTTRPLCAGGTGLLEVVAAARPAARREPLIVSGPLGEPVPVALLVDQDGEGAPVEVFIETGLVLQAGPATSSARERGTSLGVGELLVAARRAIPAGLPGRIVIGVGEATSHDGGAGLLAALGVGPERLLRAGNLGLAEAAGLGLTGLLEARSRFAGVPMTAAIERPIPLLGLAGASADLPEPPETTQKYESRLGSYAQAVSAALGSLSAELLAGGLRRLSSLPGAGAGGGVGFALAALGADLRPGPSVVAEETGLAAAVAASDLVVTGEACFDWDSLRDSVATTVSGLALDVGRPVLVIAGEALVGRREATAAGIEAVYPVAGTTYGGPTGDPGQWPGADAAAALSARTARVARTWSRLH